MLNLLLIFLLILGPGGSLLAAALIVDGLEWRIRRVIQGINWPVISWRGNHSAVELEGLQPLIDHTTGEVLDEGMYMLLAQLDEAERELRRLRGMRLPILTDKRFEELTHHVEWLNKQGENEKNELVGLRLRVMELEAQLATTDVPVGQAVVRGRLIVTGKYLIVVGINGRHVRFRKADGCSYEASTGDQVLLRGVLGDKGFSAWQVTIEKLAGELEPMDGSLVTNLTSEREGKKAPGFNELDMEAHQNNTRTASHSKTAISLHVVLPTHARFSMTVEQAGSLKKLMLGLVEELDLGKVEALEIGNTEGGRQRDHLHMLVSGWDHVSEPIGKSIGRLKALSSGRLRRLHPDLPPKLWSASYWASSAGGSLDKVISYINTNAEKHADGL